MASLNIEQLADLLVLTQKSRVKGRYTSLLADLPSYWAANIFIKKSKMMMQPGPDFRWPVQLNGDSSFRAIAPTTPDFAEITDDFTEAVLPQRKVSVSTSFIEEMGDFNKGPNEIADLIQAKEDKMDVDFIKGFEQMWWSFPLITDTLRFFGLPYWVTKNATTGFTGGIPTGHSTVANLSPTSIAGWNNYAGLYTNPTADGLFRSVRIMGFATDFQPILSKIPDLGAAGTGGLGYYVNINTKMAAADASDARNDNIGPDLSKHDTITTIRRADLNYVPWLDRDTTDPFYQINWNVFKLLYISKWWQRPYIIKPVPGKRNQIAKYKDTYCQPACFNRRLCGVLATAATYTGA